MLKKTFGNLSKYNDLHYTHTYKAIIFYYIFILFFTNKEWREAAVIKQLLVSSFSFNAIIFVIYDVLYPHF